MEDKVKEKEPKTVIQGKVKLCSWALVLMLFLTSPGTLLAILLALIAETWASRFFACSLLCLVVATVLLSIALRRSGKRIMVSSWIMYGLGLFGCIGCYIASPSGQSSPRFQSHFPGKTGYARLSPANLVREIDQLKLGAVLMPRLDRHIDRRKGKRLKKLFMTVYREMQSDPDFVDVGSVMHYAYAEVGGRPFDIGHMYVYRPEQVDSEKLPVILFLHGSLGNFKGYLWVWKQFADAHGFAIVAPSFGFGNWHRPGGVAAIESARQYCVEQPDLDEDRVILAGLSNGGFGVSRAARITPTAYKGLIYLSGVMEPKVLQSSEFVKGWKDRPVLVIHGGKDERIPKDYIDRNIENLERNSIHPTVKVFDDEDHFLFFSKRVEMIDVIHAWIVDSGLE
jgi:pimeloyl-ACP methyl ester carboxylesterase